MSDNFKPMNRSNVGPAERPVLVQKVSVERLDKQGKWREDETPGILVNPQDKAPKDFPR